jgi:hypothetical protein
MQARPMIRALKILGLLGLGGVLTLAALFLSGASIIWRAEYIPPASQPQPEDYVTSDPYDFGRGPGRMIRHGSRYIPLAESADSALHEAARQSLENRRTPAAADTFALAGHRIVPGKGAVIAYHHGWGLSEPGQYPPEAGFEKLTIFLAEPLAGESGTLELGAESGAFAFWSTGRSNPPWANACVGYATEGRVGYRHNRDRMDLELTLKFEPVHAESGETGACETVDIRTRASAWIGKTDYLDAWDGGGWGRVTIHEAVQDRGL